jgi:hypothetical protein
MPDVAAVITATFPSSFPIVPPRNVSFAAFLKLDARLTAPDAGAMLTFSTPAARSRNFHYA